VARHTHSLARSIRLTTEFFASHEYAGLTRLGARWAGVFRPERGSRRGERSQTVRISARSWTGCWRGQARPAHPALQGSGRDEPGATLGHHHDPVTRRMLQVRIDDAIRRRRSVHDSNGRQVEPRRDFIEQNALDVLNLDI